MLDILVVGIIRNPDEFKATFTYLIQERNRGRVDRIVLSTWKSMADSNADELRWCARNGITVVLSFEPVKTMMGNTWKQHRAILAGLPHVTPDRPILKTRSDKAMDETRNLVEEFAKTGMTRAAGGTLAYKAICLKLSTSMMFNLSDMAFIMNAQDLRKFLNCEGYYDVIAVTSTINAEVRMFSWPFVQRYRFVSEIYENFNIRRISAKLADSSGSEVPEYLLAAYFSYFRLVRANFRLLRSGARPSEGPLERVWQTAPEGLTSKAVLSDGFHLTIKSDEVLTQLAELRFTDSTLKERAEAALARVAGLPADAPFLPLFPIEDMRQFDRTYPGPGPSIRLDPILWTET
ncbi:hypothetical protein [Xanthobacter agilis]|uniref:hypothetical protein n=1 Tax=Xanthobacter agilis TaxID=47492 RepID=UPI00372B9FDF